MKAKKNYFIVDRTTSDEDNLKKLMNIIFKTEIACMILQDKKPSYYKFKINGIYFKFQDINSETKHHYRKLYPQLKISYEKQFNHLYRNRDNIVKTSIGIKDDSKIDIDKVKKRYEKLKSAREEEQVEANNKSEALRVKNQTLEKVRINSKVLSNDYLQYNNYDADDSKNNSFTLTLNKLTESEVQQIMYVYRKIKGVS